MKKRWWHYNLTPWFHPDTSPAHIGWHRVWHPTHGERFAYWYGTHWSKFDGSLNRKPNGQGAAQNKWWRGIAKEAGL
jgi:hypothetical protein